jgi:anti-sigma-K factor RskA
VDDDTLSLVALGEPVSADVDAHLASCPVCHERVGELREVVDLGRTLSPDDRRPAPPPAAVWDRIAAAVAVEPAPTASVATLPARVRGESRPRSTGRIVGAFAVAAVIIALGVFAIVALAGDDSASVAETAALEPLEGSGAQGRAELVVNGERRELRVDTTGLTPRSGDYYELWLLDDDVTQLVSLGPVDPERPGTFRVPDGLDISRLRVVDVSVEPLDGVPTHSGESVLRGTLRA